MSVKSSSFDDVSCDTTINEDVEEKKENDSDSLDPRIQVSCFQCFKLLLFSKK